MILYYTNNYDKNKKSSHELLETAIAMQLGGVAEAGFDMKSDAEARTDAEAKAKAKVLLSKLYKSTDYGKPAIPDYAEFSITHSESTWAVLIDEKTVHSEESIGCGLDIQYIKDAGVESVCRKYYTEDEQAAVASSGKSEFFRIWARREALVKTVGTTIVNRALPSVMADEVEFEGRTWIVKDLTIPGLEGACAAMACSLRDDEEVKYVEIA